MGYAKDRLGAHDKAGRILPLWRNRLRIGVVAAMRLSGIITNVIAGPGEYDRAKEQKNKKKQKRY